MMNFRTNGTAKVCILKARNNRAKQPTKPSKMATTFSNTGKKFDNHPEGAFAAVCADVYTEEKENKYYNTKQKNQRGEMEIDKRKTVTKFRIKFYTTEAIEIDGDLKPRIVMYFSGFSWGDNAKLRQFVRGWVPEVGRMSKEDVDFDALIGRTAWITVSQWDNGEGTSVSNAVALPPGVSAPLIPSDFVRHKDKAAPAGTDNPQAGYEAPKQGIGQTAGDPF